MVMFGRYFQLLQRESSACALPAVMVRTRLSAKANLTGKFWTRTTLPPILNAMHRLASPILLSFEFHSLAVSCSVSASFNRKVFAHILERNPALQISEMFRSLPTVLELQISQFHKSIFRFSKC
uniref:Uncharacterized protein n=1 Tax=Arundo donax TaxID=35708 RepID=A0A0A9FK23_ARUDO